MHIVELKENLTDTSFESDIIYSKRLLNHIYSILDIATDINYTDYKYISTLSSKMVVLLDKIDYVLVKEVLENVEYKKKYKK